MLDKATGAIIDESMTDGWSSDLNALGGTTGRRVTGLRREWAQGADIVSANALPLGTDGNLFKITGTTSVTSFTSVPQAGAKVMLWFSGALTLTHGSNIKLPGAVNITTVANTFIEAISDGTNLWFSMPTFPASTPLMFQTAADAGKRFQSAKSGSATSNNASGGVFISTTLTVSWPATFAGIPTAFGQSAYNGSTAATWAGADQTSSGPSTTAASPVHMASSSASTGQIQCWAIG